LWAEARDVLGVDDDDDAREAEIEYASEERRYHRQGNKIAMTAVGQAGRAWRMEMKADAYMMKVLRLNESACYISSPA
jgi:hypothetical protein